MEETAGGWRKDEESETPAPILRPEMVMRLEDGPEEHPLEYSFTYSYFKRPPGKFNPEEYSNHVQNIATFATEGVKPVWEDEANREGGKWIVRLKKGLASRIWENLILAILGEQFMVGDEICGAVCSVRNQEDIVSLWNRTAKDEGITNRIRDTMRRTLNLPPNTVLEYKPHDDCLRYTSILSSSTKDALE